jgi:NADPH-dependent curcumin reductase CurA
MQRLTVIGFIVSDELELFPAAFEHLSGMLAAGKLHYDETIVDSFENALDALGQLFAGANTGKLLVRVAEPG